ncbi:MAG TPA: STAS domain-containing protein [Candidatus Acidoferrum sp.]|nr:STAS domain-containing protein [Candidatus Acidoferrum sp.]
METAIGVFATRDRAAEAVQELLRGGIPEDCIVFLTRSETDAQTVGKQFGANTGGVIGGEADMSAAGVAAVVLLPAPGIGPVFALGLGGAALLGLVGAGTGCKVSASLAEDSNLPVSASETGLSTDVAFFRRVLNAGHSLIVVRTDYFQIAATSCEILDRLGLGLGMRKDTDSQSMVSTREADGAVIADFDGKIALADGTRLLRDTVCDFLALGHKRILLNLEGVDFIDSAGLGELVRAHASIRSRGGHLKLLKPRDTVLKLLQITKLDRLFDIEQDEVAALVSIRKNVSAQAAG